MLDPFDPSRQRLYLALAVVLVVGGEVASLALALLPAHAPAWSTGCERGMDGEVVVSVFDGKTQSTVRGLSACPPRGSILEKRRGELRVRVDGVPLPLTTTEVGLRVIAYLGPLAALAWLWMRRRLLAGALRAPGPSLSQPPPPPRELPPGMSLDWLEPTEAALLIVLGIALALRSDLAAFIVPLMALVVVAGGALTVFTAGERNLLRFGASAEGVLVPLLVQGSGPTTMLCQIETPQGKKTVQLVTSPWRLRRRLGSWPQEGDRVIACYDPADPAVAAVWSIGRAEGVPSLVLPLWLRMGVNLAYSALVILVMMARGGTLPPILGPWTPWTSP